MGKIPVFTINRKVNALSSYTVGIKGPNFELERLDIGNSVDQFDRFLCVVADIKSQFERSVKQHSLKKIKLTYHRQHSTLYKLLEPFSYWALWSNSEYCSFNELEIKIISTYLKVQNIKICASLLQLAPEKAETVFRKCIFKLKQNNTFSDYRWWLSNQLQQTNRKDLFLNAPLMTLNNKIPMKTLSILCRLGSSLADVLGKTSEIELVSIKGIGNKGIKELKEILEKFDCLDQLRSA